MRVVATSARLSAFAPLAATLLLSLTVYGQTAPAQPQPKSERPVNMLVLGDSISWGQGLKDEHKIWHLIKSWLEQNTGREVRAKVEAHSGALIGTPGGSGVDPRAEYGLDGELSRAFPTVNDQIDNAIPAFPDPSVVDLVLVDGCINDVDARRLLNGVNTPDSIRELAQAKCGAPVEALLNRIVNAFTNAHVVITGYYPIITEKTTNDLFMRTLARRFYTPAAGSARLNDKALRARLIAISREWYQTSDQMLAAAARKLDAQSAARGSRQRVLFASAGFYPEHSFAASQSRLWGFDASALRKMLVVLTLGKVKLRTNDERRSQRSELCKIQYQKPAQESLEEKSVREDRLLRCKLAAVGHPNRKGAAMYAEAIGRLLRALIAETGWLKATQTIANPVP